MADSRTTNGSLRAGWLPLASALLALVAVQAGQARVYAASGTWTASGSVAGANATWGRTANWSGGIVADGTDSTAQFSVSATSLAALTNNITLGNLTTVNSARVNVVGTDTNYATQAPSAYQIEFATTTGTAPRISNAGRLDAVVTVAGNQGFTKAGNGTLYLWAPNVYSGVTTITGSSQIYLRNASGLGAVGAGNGTVVEAGSTLRIDTAMTTAAEPLTISGSGQSGPGFLGALRTNNSSSFAADYTGPITLAADAKITAAPTTTLTLSGPINLGSNTLQLQDAGDMAISGAIGGTGSVDYTGTGPAGFVMSGSSTFTGALTVGNAGGPFSMTGYVAAATSVGGGSGRYVIGTGTFGGGLSILNTIKLSPGASGTTASASYGTLTASTLEVQSGAVLLGIQDATTYDRLVMTAGSGGLTLGGTASLSLDLANLLPDFSTLNLLNFTGLSGNFQSVSSSGQYAGTWTGSSGIFSLANVGPGGAQTLTFDQSTGVLAVIPEPSSIAIVGGVVSLASLLVWRRRRGF